MSSDRLAYNTLETDAEFSARVREACGTDFIDESDAAYRKRFLDVFGNPGRKRVADGRSGTELDDYIVGLSGLRRRELWLPYLTGTELDDAVWDKFKMQRKIVFVPVE